MELSSITPYQYCHLQLPTSSFIHVIISEFCWFVEIYEWFMLDKIKNDRPWIQLFTWTDPTTFKLYIQKRQQIKIQEWRAMPIYLWLRDTNSLSKQPQHQWHLYHHYSVQSSPIQHKSKHCYPSSVVLKISHYKQQIQKNK